MTFVDQVKRIGVVNFDGGGDLAAAEDWIENVENIMEVMEVPQERSVWFWLHFSFARVHDTSGNL